MSAKQAVKYFTFTITSFGYILIASYGLNVLKQIGQRNFNYTSYWMFHFFAYVLFGVLLAIFSFLDTQLNRNGKWMVNIEKLIFIGIPAFFFACSYLIYYQIIYLPILIGIMNIIIHYGAFIEIMQVIFGYILISSFYKDKT